MKPGVISKRQRRKILEAVLTTDITKLEAFPDAKSLELEKLIHEVMEKNGSALVALFDRVSTPLYFLALTMLQKEAPAGEVLQETFSWIWLHACKFRGHPRSAFSWLIALVRERALRQLWNSGPSDALLKYCQTILEGMDPDLADQKEMWNFKIRRAFKMLSGEEQRILKLAFLGGFDQFEMAQEIHISPENLRQNAYLGMVQLYDAIEKSSS